MNENKILKALSKEEAAKIVEADPELKKEFEGLRPYYESGSLDHSFGFGNFFNKYDAEKGEISPNEIVIQWLDGDDSAYDMTVESLEECVVRLKEIEEADGFVDAKTSEIEIDKRPFARLF